MADVNSGSVQCQCQWPDAGIEHEQCHMGVPPVILADARARRPCHNQASVRPLALTLTRHQHRLITLCHASD
jgi:hypothetical protein